jgi:hypothetical protein
LLFVLLGPAIPLVLIGRITRKVIRGRRHIGTLLGCFPQFVVITSAWCLGEFVGYLTGRESAR